MLKNVIGHENVVKNLESIKENLPRVLLFTGQRNIGKTFTAYNLIDEIYKGTLTNRLKGHPDIILTEPETNTFKIDQVRNIKKKTLTTPFELDQKFFILRKIDHMNVRAANACLKMLEDCPDYCYFIMTAENPANVLSTVKSRSIIFSFYPLYDLSQYIENITPFEEYLIGGCVGNVDAVKLLDTEKLEKDCDFMVRNINEIRYANLVDWFVIYKDMDKDILVNGLRYSCNKVLSENPSNNEATVLVAHLNKFLEKLHSNLNLNMHFMNALYQSKDELKETNARQ